MLLDKQSGRSQINAWLFLEREGKKSQLLIRGPWCRLISVLQLSRVDCTWLLRRHTGRFSQML